MWQGWAQPDPVPALPDPIPVDAQHHDTAALLRTEHAVAAVLADAPDDDALYSRLLAAIGESLGWSRGGLWLVGAEGSPPLRAAAWPDPRDGDGADGGAEAARAAASGKPEWCDDHGPAVLGFPIRGVAGVLGAIEFVLPGPGDPGAGLLATVASLGDRIGQSVERRRAETGLRESDARKGAIIDAAFDCIITMDAAGSVVEVNRATERTFGYRAEEMVGRELAELIVPPELREAHRRGVARYVAGGDGWSGTRSSCPRCAPTAASSRSRSPSAGPTRRPAAVHRLPARRHRAQARRGGAAALAEEQAALRRVATEVASEAAQERVFAVVTEEVGQLLGAHTSNMVRFESDGTAVVVGAWSTGGVGHMAMGTRLALDGPTVAARILPAAAPSASRASSG